MPGVALGGQFTQHLARPDPVDNSRMTIGQKPPGWLERAGIESEKWQRSSPRRVEMAAAFLLGVLAAMLFYDLVLRRWFYFRFHQYYRSTPESRAYDWTVACCEILVGAWLVGLALNLARGASRRKDQGLFSPAALRVWGVLFALIPFGLLAFPNAVFHLHFWLWFWSAAIACFTLAARRARPAETENTPRPIE